jgi:hypothetical protein
MKYLRYFENKNILYGHDVEEIRNNYFEAALWLNEDNAEFDNKTIFNFSSETKEKTNTEILWFIYNANKSLNNITDTSIGHDLWMTRNGEGIGFWDRDYSDSIGKKLTGLAKKLGESSIYVNDDGEIDIDTNSNELVSDFVNFVDIEQYKKSLIQKKYNL